jgi:hypothetical protein
VRIQDHAQNQLDRAARKYRREYDRGYLLSQQGDSERAQRILDKANREYAEAKRVFTMTTGRKA